MTSDASEGLAVDVGELLLELADNGLADQVGTWVSATTDNEPITGEQLRTAMDSDELQAAAAEAGMSVTEFADRLAAELPAAADAVTPGGELPDDAEVHKRLQNL
ncbi:YidB family protein [Actinomadura gamaensis]|uniref:YidB family protein n=1 Tax=Actinomadura gamaensis TaxID=1763541 RepID=A0ABV9UA51_9ACTN